MKKQRQDVKSLEDDFNEFVARRARPLLDEEQPDRGKELLNEIKELWDEAMEDEAPEDRRDFLHHAYIKFAKIQAERGYKRGFREAMSLIAGIAQPERQEAALCPERFFDGVELSPESAAILGLDI